ncbi:NAD(P)/FAD-dependent oxidoreductase [Sulfuriflexus mobilis]|uniref:NAD(P)/FAD-dependent oxidoreductase n=1 Tax=Sulfuriflexus mobilis TaxID=1811807 RepID=UPI000F841434|nr:FAD/NAD(P)-binding oxidoreductase [Sulfuriflexus mobilis]
MAHIVILGAGIGGIASAYEMHDLKRAQDKITVISNSDHFQFTPSNPWVAVRWRKPDDISVAMGPVFKDKGIDFISTGARRVYPDSNEIELNDDSRVVYDYLIIASGPRLAFDEIEGLGPEGHTASVCTTDHAADAAQRWDKFVAAPGPIVVGAVQAASCFGPAYEFAFILDADLRKRKIRDKVPMTFVTSEPYIGHLGLGGVGDSKGMMESELRNHHINWICNAKVSKVEADKMYVSEYDENGNEKKQHELPFKYSMMLPAFTGIDAVRDVEGLANPRGFIVIDEFQRNPKYPNVYGVGVCVAIAPPVATPVPTGVPKTGYMIETMAYAAAANICATLDGKEATAKASWDAICLADMGDTGIAFVASPQIPPRNVNWMKKGKWVHLGKVAFEKYYLRKVRKGITESVYEKYILKTLGIEKLKS